MKIINLSFHGVKGLSEATLTDNALVLTGAVGSGKSTILDLAEMALTGAAPRGNLLGLHDAKSPTGAAVTLVAEHNGTTFRGTVTARKGKQVHVIETANGEAWEPAKDGLPGLLGVDAATLSAACFLRCHGVDGHGTFGPVGATERRVLLARLDKEMPDGLFAEWAKGAGIALPVRERIEVRLDGVSLRAAAMPGLAKTTGQDLRAKLDAVNQATARIEEVRLRMAGDQAHVDAPAGEVVDLTEAEAELDEARRLLATARAEAERNAKLHATRSMMIVQRSTARAKLDAMGADPVEVAKATLTALRTEYGKTKERGIGLLSQATALDTEANTLDAANVAVWQAYRDGQHARNVAQAAFDRASAELARIEAAAGSVVVPCGAAKQYQGCTFLTGVVAARAEIPKAREAVEAARAVLTPAQVEPDTKESAARIAELRKSSSELRTQEAACRKRCADIVTESAPLKAVEANGNAEADRLRAIISEPLPEDPGEAQDCAPFATNVAECEAVVRELRAKRDSAAGAEALRAAARERIVAAEARVDTLTTALVVDRTEAETLSALEKFYREAPRLAIKSTLRDIEGVANAFLERAGFDRMIRLEDTEPNAKGLWEVRVYVGDVLRESLSEGQLLTVDLALSAGYRAHVGLDWYTADDGFGALGGDEAERMATALDDGWVVSHKPEITLSLGERKWPVYGLLGSPASAVRT